MANIDVFSSCITAADTATDTDTNTATDAVGSCRCSGENMCSHCFVVVSIVRK